MKQQRTRRNLNRQKQKITNKRIVYVEATKEALDILVSKGYAYKQMKYTSFYEVYLPFGTSIEQALDDFDDIGINDSVEFETEIIDATIVTPNLRSKDYAGVSGQLDKYSYFDIGTRTVVLGDYVGTSDNLWQYMSDLSHKRTLTSIGVAVIEGGSAKVTHPALVDRLLVLPQFDTDTYNIHATQVTGIIVANPTDTCGVIGLAATSKVLPMWGNPESCVAKCIDNGVRIVNMSIGQSEESLRWKQITRVAKEQGCIICVASGNSNWQDIFKPNRYVLNNPNVLSISGVTGGTDVYAEGAVYDEWVDFFGPFGSITIHTTEDKSESFSGTSGACPAIASLFANMLSINPSLTWGDAVEIAARNCIPARPNVWEPDKTFPYGYGLPQFRATLRDVVRESPVSGIYDSNKNMIRQMVTMSNGTKSYATGVYDSNKKAIWRPTYETNI